MSLFNKMKKLDDKVKEQNLKNFISDLYELSKRHNMFIKPVIERDGPRLEYYSLPQSDLDKLSDKLEYDTSSK